MLDEHLGGVLVSAGSTLPRSQRAFVSRRERACVFRGEERAAKLLGADGEALLAADELLPDQASVSQGGKRGVDVLGLDVPECRDDQRMSRAQQDRQVAQPLDIGRVQLVDALLEQILGLRRSRSGAIERSLVAAKQRRMAWVSTAESLRVWKR